MLRHAAREAPARSRTGEDWEEASARSASESQAAASRARDSGSADGTALSRRRRTARPASPLTRAATAPIAIDQRAPNASAIHPASGPPIGVEPRNRMEYKAITRPRMTGIDCSCNAVMVAERNAIPVAPAAAPARAAVGTVGATATRKLERPRPTLARASRRLSIVLRLAM